MLKPMKLEPYEEDKIYSREELYTLASKNKARVIAYQGIKTDRFKIIETISGDWDLVMWQNKYGCDEGIHNLIIAESVPADGKR